MLRILIIDDDETLAQQVLQALAEAGHRGEHGADVLEGLRLAAVDGYDAIVLDPSQPGSETGLGLLYRLRDRGDITPVLIVSDATSVTDRVAGLRGGADDYLTKPFAFAELLARLEALARRSTTRLRVSDLEMDRLARTVQRAGRAIELQAMEYRLLENMMLHEGKIISRSTLVRQVWGTDEDPTTNIVDVHVSRLRQKVDQPFGHKLIHTVRGGGYRMAAGEE